MQVTVRSSEILRLRLRSQRILGAERLSPETVVRQLLAIQAQDFGQAEWSVALRTGGSTRAELFRALDSGSLVRSYPVRGTLFILAAEDLRWVLGITGPRTIRSLRTIHSRLDIDDHVLGCVEDTARSLLSGGTALTRSEFLDGLDRAGVSVAGQRGYLLIGYLSLRSVICWGPLNKGRQSLVLVDDWVVDESTPSREEALGRFALRYFTGHGPATLQDFTWWSKLTVAEARIGLAVALPALVEVVADDAVYFAAESEVDAPTSRRSATYALAGFDEYILGYQDRTLALPAEFSDRIAPGKNGIFLPTVVTGGRVTGTWRAPASARQHPSVEWFTVPGLAETRALEREFTRFRRYFGVDQGHS